MANKTAVSIEEKKRWLYRAWNMRREVEALEAAKALSYDHATSITPSYNSAQGSGGTSNPHNKFENYSLISACADQSQRELERAKAEILRAIQTIKSSDERAVMIQRYINLRNWSEVAESVHCSERKTFYLHKEALRHIRIPAREIKKMRAEKSLQCNAVNDVL